MILNRIEDKMHTLVEMKREEATVSVAVNLMSAVMMVFQGKMN